MKSQLFPNPRDSNDHHKASRSITTNLLWRRGLEGREVGGDSRVCAAVKGIVF